MKKIQVEFCNRDQTHCPFQETKTGPGGGGAFSRDFTINLSSQCRAFRRAVKTEKLKALLFRGPIGAGTSNDWCISSLS